MEVLESLEITEFNPELFRMKKGSDLPIPFVIAKAPNVTSAARAKLSTWIINSGGAVVAELPSKGPCFFVFDAKDKYAAVEHCTTPMKNPVHWSWVYVSVRDNKRDDWWRPMSDEPKPVELESLQYIRPNHRLLADFITEQKGMQLPVYIDYSIEGDERRRLAKLITQYGGFLTLFEDSARIIIADQNNGTWEEHIWGEEGLLFRVRGHDRWIEPPGALRRWTQDGEVGLTPLAKPPSQRTPKRANPRVSFTAGDDSRLVHYLAKAAPFGYGRQGNVLYQQFERVLQHDAAKARNKPADIRTKEEEDLIYAAQHPWSSWQNRYKKAKEEFDTRIDKFLEEHPYYTQRGGESSKTKRPTRRGSSKKALPVEVHLHEADEVDSDFEEHTGAEEAAAEAVVQSDEDAEGEDEEQAEEEEQNQASGNADIGLTQPPADSVQVPSERPAVVPPAPPINPRRGPGRPKGATNKAPRGPGRPKKGAKQLDVLVATPSVEPHQDKGDGQDTDGEQGDNDAEEQDEEQEAPKIEVRETRSRAAKRAAQEAEESASRRKSVRRR